MKLQVAGFLDNSLVNGTGVRSVLFVSGCKHECKGCHNDAMQNYKYGDNVEVDKIYKRIKRNVPLIKGVTFSGGEPFDKAKELGVLSDKLKKDDLNIWCYTGYKFEDILKVSDKKEEWKHLLKNIDVIVDGKYDEDKKMPTLKFKGSTNQRIIDVKSSLEKEKVIEMKL